MNQQRSAIQRIALVSGLTALIMWALLYAPTPYVVYEPGIAVPVESMINIEVGDKPGKGQFLLTAVKLTQPNFWGVIQSAFDSDRDIKLKKDVFRGYSEKQYANRLTAIMKGSQNDAIEAAYRYAGLPYKIEVESIVVSEVLKAGARKAGPFEAGDRLIGFEGGEAFRGIDDLIEKLRQMPLDHPLNFDVEREGERRTVQLDIPANQADPSMTAEKLAALLGIAGFIEQHSLVPENESDRLTIKAGEIGGPSAGLVFALQSLDLLTSGDLTGSMRIAATGTIQADGTVGAIGGIKQKVAIAGRQGAQLFIVPVFNEKEAKAKAKAMKTSMQIVGVSTLQEAIDAIAAYRSAESKV